MKGKPEKPDWRGKTVVCIASGPSLTKEDVEKVRGLPTIVTNTTFLLVPWADILFGMDAKWWKWARRERAKELDAFPGKKWSTSHAARSWGAESLYGVPWQPRGLNSGAVALEIAVIGRPDRVLLLGYDCQKTNGKTHHHGDHPRELGNAASVQRWPKHFAYVARDCKATGVKVINVSRETALTCFPRAKLEDVLDGSFNHNGHGARSVEAAVPGTECDRSAAAGDVALRQN